MGNFGFQELLLISVFLLVLIFPSLFFYWLGKKSGYKQGQLDMYKRIDDERKSKN